jgi:erythromycin esterase
MWRALGALLLATQTSIVYSADIHRLNWKAYNRSDLDFLASLLEGKSVVQLGESIQMTDEFPRARLQIVRYLHEQLGFDVLAFEGSWVESWMAQDEMYRCRKSPDCAEKVQKLAWFSVWQTEAMHEVIRYIIDTQETRNPLYLASFDIQPGTSRSFQGSGAQALAAFFGQLSSHDSKLGPPTAIRWEENLAPRTDEQRKAALQSVFQIKEVVEHIARQVRPERRARALRATANSLEKAVQLCSVEPLSVFGPGTYQQTRDRLNAENAITLRERVSQSHRIILWAHHSHINENATGRNIPSMGQRLREMIGDQSYTIGLFAGSGEAVGFDNNGDGFLRSIRPSGDYGVETALSAQAPYDFFVDLRSGSIPPIWRAEISARKELSSSMPVSLSRDFNAAVFIHRVHAPEPFATELRRAR